MWDLTECHESLWEMNITITHYVTKGIYRFYSKDMCFSKNDTIQTNATLQSLLKMLCYLEGKTSNKIGQQFFFLKQDASKFISFILGSYPKDHIVYKWLWKNDSTPVLNTIEETPQFFIKKTYIYENESQYAEGRS